MVKRDIIYCSLSSVDPLKKGEQRRPRCIAVLKRIATICARHWGAGRVKMWVARGTHATPRAGVKPPVTNGNVVSIRSTRPPVWGVFRIAPLATSISCPISARATPAEEHLQLPSPVVAKMFAIAGRS